MPQRPHFRIHAQPDDTTCGPTCLHALYRHYGDPADLASVIAETPVLAGGGTLGVMLGTHALRRGYRAHLYTYNLMVFDPTWLSQGPGDPAPPRVGLVEKLRAQAAAKNDGKLHEATDAYVEFLERGGAIYSVDLAPRLIRRYLDRSTPILTGLSATYLYKTAREFGPNDDYDDVRGEPSGHFVVLFGYDARTDEVLVADPQQPNPLADEPVYRIPIERVICAILLGVLTYDANLLIIEPGDAGCRGPSPCPT
ncbi:MAG: C39 family peptidase [Phycisphaerae bacterium]|nr:hypothetical protein [Phycisphaerae bacterium]MCZ2400813.1 C39 family peptidase [Phycisphaerae bacterium]NUQ48395.1 hypothetical protein [Phycisphaerae bacterium]